MPLFFLLFFIETDNPILLLIFSSKFFIFGSMDLLTEAFFLKILTKFSACLTDNFFSIILLATNNALSRPTRILACPGVIFFPQQILELQKVN